MSVFRLNQETILETTKSESRFLFICSQINPNTLNFKQRTEGNADDSQMFEHRI